MDQPGKLAYRKGTFNLGSSGGSGQDGRKSGLSSFRGAGRGVVTSRESSEPSSREPSESRKHSVAGDRMERDKVDEFLMCSCFDFILAVVKLIVSFLHNRKLFFPSLSVFF